MISIPSVWNYTGHALRNRIPGQVVIQATNRCNAACPQCGMRRSNDIPRATLPDSTIRETIEACARQKVQAVSFTGGEPLLMRERLMDWIDYAGRLGIPFIRTGTNGFMFRGSEAPDFEDRIKRLAERLAATRLRNFWISIDACEPEVHERMRGLEGVVAGIAKALPIFHAAGLYPSANLGINRMMGGDSTACLQANRFARRADYLAEFHRRYSVALERFYRFVGELGFSIVNTCYPMSIDRAARRSGLSAVYAATAVEDVVRFEDDEKAMLFKALLDVIPRYRRHLRIFTPLSSIYTLYRFYAHGPDASEAFGCRGGRDFFFIDAQQGDTFPCGYRGHENLGKFRHLDLKRLPRGQDCHRCDWECFRDPSEFCAPVLQGIHAPLKLLRRLWRTPDYGRCWWQDLTYYRRCDFFDGRKPMNRSSLDAFARTSSSKTISALTPA